MIKRTILIPPRPERREPDWLPLERTASVEITSEDAAHPIEAALSADDTRGWRAASPGEQIVRLLFAEPTALRHIRVVVVEAVRARTQQFVLRVATTAGGPWREIARQQFNFSPGGARREQEDYTVQLGEVAALELAIIPDLSGGDARASLQQLRVA